MTKTIIHISTFLQGGAGKLICELISHQVISGYRVLCVCNNESYSGYENYPEYEQCLIDLQVPLLKIPGLFKRGELEQSQAVLILTAKLGDVADSGSIALIHAHAAIPAWVAMQFRRERAVPFPVISTMHGWGSNKTVQQETQDIRILSELDAVVVVSGSAVPLLESKGLQQSHLVCIYNGVEQKVREPDKSILPLWFSGDADSLFKVVCLGSVCERKNQLLLLEALADLQSTGLNFVCVLIGDHDKAYVVKLESFIQQQGLSSTVILNGPLVNADRYLGCFDLMVLPTRAEGMPMSILEAFREQTLVLSSDIDECKELIEDGQNGFLFEGDNFLSLADKLRRIQVLETSQRRSIIECAYQRFQSCFTQEAMFQAYDELYRNLLKQAVCVTDQTLTSKTE